MLLVMFLFNHDGVFQAFEMWVASDYFCFQLICSSHYKCVSHAKILADLLHLSVDKAYGLVVATNISLGLVRAALAPF